MFWCTTNESTLATGGDIFVHIKSARRDACFLLTQVFYSLLPKKHIKHIDEVDGWVFLNSQDLSGFEDGAANPKGSAKKLAAVVDERTVSWFKLLIRAELTRCSRIRTILVDRTLLVKNGSTIWTNWTKCPLKLKKPWSVVPRLRIWRWSIALRPLTSPEWLSTAKTWRSIANQCLLAIFWYVA